MSTQPAATAAARSSPVRRWVLASGLHTLVRPGADGYAPETKGACRT
jgi:hypothetical protein